MADRVRKPEWLKINIGANERYTETKRIAGHVNEYTSRLPSAVSLALIWENAGGKERLLS